MRVCNICGVPYVFKTKNVLTNGTPGIYKHIHIPNVFTQHKINTYKKYVSDADFRRKFEEGTFKNIK